ncbi:MAG: hypothetical protein J6X17_02505 [Lachnospiraceae bacterium]|nr:hypothetical protein [Lachnospiraceae bacterium]
MLGKIDISALNAPPEKHEFETVKYFANRGKDITFLKPSDIPNLHTPDILMDGVEWEMKCPLGSGKRTIEANFRKAVMQSKYIIFDIRYIKIPEKQCISQLEKEFNARPYIKRLYVIRKNGELLMYPKGD